MALHLTAGFSRPPSRLEYGVALDLAGGANATAWTAAFSCFWPRGVLLGRSRPFELVQETRGAASNEPAPASYQFTAWHTQTLAWASSYYLPAISGRSLFAGATSVVSR